MNILVFKTNLQNKQEIRRAGSFLKQLSGIIRWNVDLHDEDNVLRVVTASLLSPRSVEQLLQQAGYHCQELED